MGSGSRDFPFSFYAADFLSHNNDCRTIGLLEESRDVLSVELRTDKIVKLIDFTRIAINASNLALKGRIAIWIL